MPPTTTTNNGEKPFVSSTTKAHLSSTRFADLDISPLTKQAIATVLRFENCTAVQEQTLPVILEGGDVIAKAKTGTGKTVAFLLPTIERLIASEPSGRAVDALAISPTRELASQIQKECEQLITFLKPKLSTLVVFGGTNVQADVRAFRSRVPNVLVATPGRLIDLMVNHNLLPLFERLRVLIFDEADQLLEQGFRPDVERILGHLQSSKATRQTLLFSATLPGDVMQVAKIAAKPSVKLVDTVGEEEATHMHVQQQYTVTTAEAQPAELFELVRQMQATGETYKLVVFFVTARLTQLYAEVFNKMGISVLEIHSRKSQSHRTNVAEQFRRGSNMILFSSDVSARGMDYPDVTAVVQVGMPSDRAQYIHRLGRTARAGKSGGGFLLLADFEAGFVRQLSDLPLAKRQELAPAVSAQMLPQFHRAFGSLGSKTLGCGYQAYLGFYNSNLKRLRWSQNDLVQNANEFAINVLGLPSPPPLEAKTVGKMGLKGVPGLVIAGRGGVPPIERPAGGGKGGRRPGAFGGRGGGGF